MSKILLAFCLQKKLKVFGECLITEKKRSGFEVLKHGEAKCITKYKTKKRSGFEVFKHGEAKCITKYKMKKQSRFEGVTHGKAMCVIQLTGIVNYIKTDYLSNTIY